MKDPDGDEAFEVGEDEDTDGPETRYGTQDRKLPTRIEQFVLNWLVMTAKNAGLGKWYTTSVRSVSGEGG